MTRTKLVEQLAQRYPSLDAGDVRTVADTLFAAMTSTLAAGGRIEVRGFGSFQLARVAGRQGRNPMTGEAVNVPPKARVKFKAGQALRGRLAGQG